MQDEYFNLGSYLKEVDKPEKCACGSPKIQTANYKDLPIKKYSGFKWSNRHAWICVSCGSIFGLVKNGIDNEQFIKTFTDGDHGERYEGISKKIH